MKALHLTLKKKWFDMIASGEKMEEYREIKPYWVKRLCAEHSGCFGCDLMDRHKPIAYAFKQFSAITFRLGYAKDAPEIIVEWLGCEVGSARSEWSDNWQGDVFVIKLGKILTPLIPGD